MTWSKRTTIQRPRAWANTGVYRELFRRLRRRAGSRWRLALVERRNRWMAAGLEVTREEATAFAGWRGPLA